ncbi:hypothetical protein NUM_22150 [Actinocatenispora comari]|uniref:Uncharacterized protein n=1 Tax=Actinocatenispora comari TaxID=2807577 RepID=A0A8J4EK29_9ACTN|nr:hypothetical protein NUM_22150 [Actinocatenispora comari]
MAGTGDERDDQPRVVAVHRVVTDLVIVGVRVHASPSAGEVVPRAPSRYFIIGTFVVNMSIDRYGGPDGGRTVEESR